MQEFPCIDCRVERLSRLRCSPLQLENVKMNVAYGYKARKRERKNELKIFLESFKISGLVHCHSMQCMYIVYFSFHHKIA